jgi:hypothetical protein
VNVAATSAQSPIAGAERRKRLAIGLVTVAVSVLVLLLSLEFLRRQGLDLGTWLAATWVLISAIPLPFVVVALSLKAAEVSLNSLAWTTVLRAAHPEETFTFRQTLGVVQGGVGIFAIVPPKFGGFAVLGLYRLGFPTIPLMTVISTRAVQGAASSILGILLFLVFAVATSGIGGQPGYLNWLGAFYAEQPVLAGALTALLAAGIIWLVRNGREWLHGLATEFALGGAILRSPRRYALRVVFPTLLAFAFRWALTGTMLAAFGIPVIWDTLLRVNVSHGLARIVQVTPGGLGTTQAVDLVSLRPFAPIEVIAAYSLSQTALLLVFNLVFGLIALIWAFGWDRTAGLLRLPGSRKSLTPSPSPSALGEGSLTSR